MKGSSSDQRFPTRTLSLRAISTGHFLFKHIQLEEFSEETFIRRLFRIVTVNDRNKRTFMLVSSVAEVNVLIKLFFVTEKIENVKAISFLSVFDITIKRRITANN
jgi:hypothetical protein